MSDAVGATAITVTSPVGAGPGELFSRYVKVDLSQFDYAAILLKIGQSAWGGITDEEERECSMLLAKEVDESIDFVSINDDMEHAAIYWAASVVIGGLRRGINLVMDRFGD